MIPAYPVDDVHDPTGAGDAFAGGFMGCLAASGKLTQAAVRRAMAVGTVVASFTVEAFSLDRLAVITRANIDDRITAFREMIRL